MARGGGGEKGGAGRSRLSTTRLQRRLHQRTISPGRSGCVVAKSHSGFLCSAWLRLAKSGTGWAEASSGSKYSHQTPLIFLPLGFDETARGLYDTKGYRLACGHRETRIPLLWTSLLD